MLQIKLKTYFLNASGHF